MILTTDFEPQLHWRNWGVQKLCDPIGVVQMGKICTKGICFRETYRFNVYGH